MDTRFYNSVMAMHPDLLIIGGGIIGMTTAYLAAKAGLQVEVLERGEWGREASWAGAGILPPGAPEFTATPLDRLRAVGSQAMPAFAAELLDITGIDNCYRRCGAMEWLASADEYALELWDAEQIRYECLTAVECRQLEPGLTAENIPGQAILLPDCAQLRNPWHLRALQAACRNVGVCLSSGDAAVGWLREGSRIRGVQLADGTTKHAGHVLLAAGSWSEALLEPLGHRPGVHPVLGQIALLKPSRPLVSRVLMVGKEYLVPRTDGRVLVGSTEEPEAGFVKRTTPQATWHLRRWAETLIPQLAEAETETCWAGLRPGTIDGWPYLGPIPGWENASIAAGHFRAGVQLSFGTARVMVEWLTHQPLSVPLESFRLDRTPLSGVRLAFRS